jgi:predicted Zn-dependent peptidase
MRLATVPAALLVLLAGCQEAVPPPAPPPAPPPPPAAETPAPPADPLGSRPALATAPPFAPPAPETFKTENGLTVWLFERHNLPLVSVTLSVPYGASSDPQGKEGLAHITADMLDEGAGARNAVELSTAVRDLGASLGTFAGVDGSSVSFTVLKKNLKPMAEIFADVVTRPRFDPKEWRRVSSLWKNDLAERAQDPSAVSRVVTSAALYGPGSPYGHPTNGLLSTASHVDLPAVKAFYRAHFRPDKATLVIAGDVTRADLAPLLEASLGGWKAPATAPEPPPTVTLRPDRPRLVLVDRADAPQSVVAVVRDGVSAADPRAPLLDLVNTALGGSFTSRLNQDLREDHGWTYGVGSAFTETRGQGAFVVRASVVTESTGPALRAMLADLDKMASEGPTDEEVAKVKAQDRADLVQTYATLGSVGHRLGTLAVLGLGTGFDAQASRARQEASRADLAKLSTAVSPAKATIVVVGPSTAVTPQLAELGLGEPVRWNEEGVPVPAKK